jgi:hypothetical protein
MGSKPPRLKHAFLRGVKYGGKSFQTIYSSPLFLGKRILSFHTKEFCNSTASQTPRRGDGK